MLALCGLCDLCGETFGFRRQRDKWEMPKPKDGLTLGGLARILRDHMNGTAARFAEVGARIDDLRRENAEVAGMVRALSQIVLRQVDEVAEHRQPIRQVF